MVDPITLIVLGIVFTAIYLPLMALLWRAFAEGMGLRTPGKPGPPPKSTWSPLTRAVMPMVVVWITLGLPLIVYRVLLHDNLLPLHPRYAPYFALIEAVDNRDIATARRLLDQGADPNLQPPFYDAETYSNPLNQATVHSDAAMVKLLLAHGADPNRGDAWYEDAVTLAALNNDIPMLELLAAKCDTATRDEALAMSALKGQKKAVHCLLARGANPDQQYNGKPLTVQVEDEIARLLRETMARSRRSADRPTGEPDRSLLPARESNRVSGPGR